MLCAPNASWGIGCAWSTAPARYSSSLAGCVELCAAGDGVPACPSSLAAAWLGEVANQDHFRHTGSVLDKLDVHWLGAYSRGGDWRCMASGVDADLSGWEHRPPLGFALTVGQPRSCAMLVDGGRWGSGVCDVRAATWSNESWPCLCASGQAAIRSDWPAHADELAAELQDGIHLTAGLLYATLLLLAVAFIVLMGATDTDVRRALRSTAISSKELLRRSVRSSSSISADISAESRELHSELHRSSAEHRELHRKLETTMDSAAYARARVKYGLFSAGVLLIVLAMAPFFCLLIGTNIRELVGPAIAWWPAIPPGLVAILLTVMPTAHNVHFLVKSLVIGGVGVTLLVFCVGVAVSTVGAPLIAVAIFGIAAIFCGATISNARLLRRRFSRREELRGIWCIFRVQMPFAGLVFAYAALVVALHPDDWLMRRLQQILLHFPSLIGLAVSFWTSALLATPANRGRVIYVLGSRGKRGTEQQRAAGVASLCNQGAKKPIKPSEVLEKAASLFSSIAVAKLTPEAFASSGLTGPSATPGQHEAKVTAEQLAALTEAAQLGHVDAFLSHSWRDEDDAPGHKYEVLAQWARDFQQRHEGRGPTIWLDKACINQNSIDEALACLPVFLAGCRQLLVVAGETYTSRLWCVMEVFVYLQMGKSIRDVEVHSIGSSASSVAQVAASFRSFKGENAHCFKEEDRQVLLAVIEASFGNFAVFNKVVRSVTVTNAGQGLLKLRGSLSRQHDLTLAEASGEPASMQSPHVPGSTWPLAPSTVPALE